MNNHIFFPDKRLIGEILDYQLTHSAADQVPIWPTGMLTFNLDSAPIRLDGMPFRNPCLFCIGVEPSMMMLDKGEGDILVVRMRMGAYHRLFGLDGDEYGGKIVEVGHNQFPRMVNIFNELAAAPPTLETRKAVLDRMFLELLEDALPYGLIEKFRFMAFVTKGTIGVADAAERLGVSKRTLERECKTRTGRTPKRLLRQFRFAYLGWSGQTDGPTKFDRFDEDLPFSDQAHFLREHRIMMGFNPTEFYENDAWRRQTGYCYHQRDDLSVSETVLASEEVFENEALEAEYTESMSWFPYGEETVKELGLEDWDTA